MIRRNSSINNEIRTEICREFDGGSSIVKTCSECSIINQKTITFKISVYRLTTRNNKNYRGSSTGQKKINKEKKNF